MIKGSGPILVALAAAFLVLLLVQRSCSTFLHIEREADLARSVAADAGLRTVDVMALREVLGVDLPVPELRRQCARFADLKGSLGEGLAVLVLLGHEQLVRTAVSAEGGDAAAAWAVTQARPEAAQGRRFLALRERFAERAAP